MAIAGVIIKVVSGGEAEVSKHLNSIPGVEVVKVIDGSIVAVLEGQDLTELELLSSGEIPAIQGVLAVLPAYINNESTTGGNHDRKMGNSI